MEIGGIIHLATDWKNYAEQMLKVMENAEGYKNLAGQGNYSVRPNFRPTTKFESKGKRLGHGVWDLLYTRAS
jgi:tRNA (guanine-N7-)-methyltransferase